LACDFFTLEIIWLKTIYGLFFIELETRRVRLTGCATNPKVIWVRQMVWDLQDAS